MPQKVIRVHRRHDGRYVCCNEVPTDGPLGVDASLSQALGTAMREATSASRATGCRVRIEVMDAGGKWREIDAVDPPRA
jgi:hypothetical protein